MSVLTAEVTRKVPGSAAASVGRTTGASRMITAGGIAMLLAVAGLGVGTLLQGNDATFPSPAVAAAAALPVPTEIVVPMAYAPGASSGWHVHPVNHTVEVLSGTLAVYDGSCQPRFYGPGQTYVGGTEPHLARNEGDAPVEMVVTTTEPSVAIDSVRHLPAPAGCSVA